MSYWGMAGGFWALSIFALAAVAYGVSDNDHKTVSAIVYAVAALAFVPAIVVSITPTSRRNLVLRAETALCMVLAFAGLFFFDPGIAVLLSPPTIMLATGAELVFQGKPKSS
jgi:hypothetical protein